MRRAGLALLLFATGSLAQQPATSTSAWWRDYAAHARQVPIGGRRTLHMLCEGRDSPTILLESGGGDGTTVWRKLQPALARHHRVCAYDRAGLGLSPARPGRSDLNAVVGDLERLVERAFARPSYWSVIRSAD